jgi:biotin operon repressor
LAVLQDGAWHDGLQITNATGSQALHSDIHELRENGCVIEQRYNGKTANGRRLSQYRLVPDSGKAAEVFDCAYEERAGMIQYDAGYSRAEAEQRASIRMERRQRRDGTIDINFTQVMPKQPPKPQAPQTEEQLGQMSFEEFKQAARARFKYE